MRHFKSGETLLHSKIRSIKINTIQEVLFQKWRVLTFIEITHFDFSVTTGTYWSSYVLVESFLLSKAVFSWEHILLEKFQVVISTQHTYHPQLLKLQAWIASSEAATPCLCNWTALLPTEDPICHTDKQMTIQEFKSQKDVHKISPEMMLLQVFILRSNKKNQIMIMKKYYYPDL